MPDPVRASKQVGRFGHVNRLHENGAPQYRLGAPCSILVSYADRESRRAPYSRNIASIISNESWREGRYLPVRSPDGIHLSVNDRIASLPSLRVLGLQWLLGNGETRAMVDRGPNNREQRIFTYGPDVAV